jgi:LysM repeat protein
MTFDRSPMPTSPLSWRRRCLGVAKGLVVPALVAALITAGSPGFGDYRIKRGDTLGRIALEHGTTVRELVRLNQLPGNGNTIYAGEVLRVPRKAARKPGTQRSAGGAYRWVPYRIRSGDTIYEIARRYRVKVSTLLAANRMGRGEAIYAGRLLAVRVPVKHTPRKNKRNTFGDRTYPDHVVAAADRNRAELRRRKHPSKASVRTMITGTARRYGVPPELALAIAWQESGWKQRVVSPANAIGTMQVIPSTGEFSSRLVGRRLDLLRARDNILAGVALLDRLTEVASEPVAIAAYYQGLGGVRRNGMYADTKRYVVNVLRIKYRLQHGWNPLR